MPPVSIPRNTYDVYVKDFNLHDLDENGALEGNEIIAMAWHQLGGESGISKEQLDSLVAEFDLNEDGKIELEEYITKVVGGEWAIAECATGDETTMKKLLGKVTKRWLSEIKSLNNPPAGVKQACDALHILLEGKSAEWQELRKFLGDRGTLKCIKEVPFEPLCSKRKKLLKPFIDDPEFSMDKIKSQSMAAGTMAALVEYLYAL